MTINGKFLRRCTLFSILLLAASGIFMLMHVIEILSRVDRYIDLNIEDLLFSGYYGQSLPVFQRKVYHPKGDVLADVN